MLAWVELLPQVFGYLLLITLPGGLLGYILGARSWQAVAYAVPLSFFITGLSGILADKLGISYGLKAYLLAAVLAGSAGLLLLLIARGFRLLFPAVKAKQLAASPLNPSGVKLFSDCPEESTVRGKGRCLGVKAKECLGLALVAVVAISFAVRMMLAFQQTDWFSQSYDNVFHLNMIERIIETGQGSLLHGLIYDAEAKGFYPLVFHDLVSLLVPFSGGSVTAGVNAFLIALVALAWPVMVYASCRVLAPRNHAVAYAGTIFAFALPAFPIHLLYYGVLYPNLLGFSVIIPLTAIVISYLERTHRFGILSALAFALAGLGACFAHPNVLFIMAYIGVAPLLWYLWSYLRNGRSRRQAATWFSLIMLALLAVAFVMMLVPRIRHLPAGMYQWVPDKTLPEALELALFSANIEMIDKTPAYLYAVMGVGAFVWICSIGLFLTKKFRWLVISHLVLVFLVVLARSGSEGFVRSWLVGWLYADARRIGTTLGISGLLIVALGLPVLLQQLNKVLARKKVFKVPFALSLSLMLLLGIGIQFNPAINYAFKDLADTYQVKTDSYVSQSEMKLMQRAAQVVPEGEKILASPWQGGALVWTLGHRQVLYPHFERLDIGAKADIPQLLRDSSQRAKACKLIQEEKAYWVLDFKQGVLWGIEENDAPYQALKDLPEAGLGKVVDSEGSQTRLVRIEACSR